MGQRKRLIISIKYFVILKMANLSFIVVYFLKKKDLSNEMFRVENNLSLLNSAVSLTREICKS